MEAILISLVAGAVATVAGFVYAFKRKRANPAGKSAKFLAILGG